MRWVSCLRESRLQVGGLLEMSRKGSDRIGQRQKVKDLSTLYLCLVDFGHDDGTSGIRTTLALDPGDSRNASVEWQ